MSSEKRDAMLSRRALLRLGSLGVGLGWSSSAQARQRGGAAAPSGPLPPSIAALQSMKNRARPFTNQERLARIEKARRLMAAEKIDAILMNGGTSPQYFANMSFGGGERLWALLIPAKGEPFIVCPAFEEDRVREVLSDSPFGPNIQIRTERAVAEHLSHAIFFKCGADDERLALGGNQQRPEALAAAKRHVREVLRRGAA